MNTTLSLSRAPVCSSRKAAAVWGRLWRHQPSDAKDDALLAREERCPRWAMIVDVIEHTFGSIEGLRTIELGSGRGDLSVLLARRGACVTLLDASDKALDQARRRFGRLRLPAAYHQADMFAIDETVIGRFDLALSSGVIEHFAGKDRTRVIRAHRDAVKPGGLAVISVPNAWCLPYRVWKFYLELRRWWPYGMEIPYTKHELMRRATGAGFARMQTRCTGLWQCVSAHWARNLFGLTIDWSQRRSWLDPVQGFTLLLFAWRDKPQQRGMLERSDGTANLTTFAKRAAACERGTEGATT